MSAPARLLAAMLAVVVAVGTAGRALCQVGCDDRRSPVAMTPCHESAGADAPALKGHDCSNEDTPAAVVTARTLPDSKIVGGLPIPSSEPRRGHTLGPRAGRHAPDDSPPLVALVVPLRI
jgi:hypothetical protein